ncbi:MAG: TonB-dependent receptor [Endomicrobiales bacterium]|nr:TonB-dependent receptor [Endomicrobiales bacterium]
MRKCLCFLVIASIISVSNVLAKSLYDGSMEELLFMEIPSIFTSTLKEQKATEAPSPVYVVTAAEIKKKGYYTLKDIMDDVPGFCDISDANENIVAVRGAFASTTNKILILINGHRMNDLNLGRWNVDQFLGIDAVERIEFIHGPGSALYGTGALLGVVNIITKEGKDVDGSYVRAKGGSFNNELNYTWGKKIDDLDAFFNFTFNDAVGAEIDSPAALNVVPAGVTQTDGKVYWNKYMKNWSALGSIRHNNTVLHVRRGHYRRATPRCPNGSYYDFDLEKWYPSYNEDDFYADLSVTIKLDDNKELVLNPSFHYFELKEQSWIGTYGANLLPPYGSRSGQFTEEVHSRMKIYFKEQVNDKLHLTIGYDGIYSDFQRSMGWTLTNGTNIALTPYYIDRGILFLNGIIGQAIYDASDIISVTAGLRYDDFAEQADSAVTPRLGFIIKPIDKLVLKVLYGKSYLAPQWAHQRSYSGNLTFKSNPDLKPEDLQAIDLIADYRMDKVNLWIDIFQNTVDNIISAKSVGGVQQYTNLGTSKYMGVEAGVKTDVIKKVNANVSASYVKDNGSDASFLTSNDDIKSISPLILRFSFEYNPIDKLSLVLWGRSYAEVYGYNPAAYDTTLGAYTGNTGKLDPWTAIDFTTNYKVNNDLDLQLQVLNIADTEYLVSDNASNRAPLPRYCRGYHVSVGYKF